MPKLGEILYRRLFPYLAPILILAVASQVGQGAIFTVSLPLKAGKESFAKISLEK